MVRALSLACRWLPSHCVCGGRISVSRPLLIRTPVLSDQGLSPVASFKLNYILKGSISTYSHIGIRASAYGFGGEGDTVPLRTIPTPSHAVHREPARTLCRRTSFCIVIHLQQFQLGSLQGALFRGASEVRVCKITWSLRAWGHQVVLLK